MDPHRLGQLRSLAYHRAVVERLRSDPSVRAKALAQLDAWLSRPTRSEPYLQAWKRLLEGPMEALVAMMEADTDEACTMRSCTPFAGAISSEERWRIWREVAEANRDA